MKKLFVAVLVVASAALASVAGAQATVDIGTAGASAVTNSTPYIAAAGGAALALWGLRKPIEIGMNFLKKMFK